MEQLFGLNSVEISFLHFLTIAIGGAFSIFLFVRSNNENKQKLLWDIYDSLYNDKDIQKLLYYMSRKYNVESITDKEERKSELMVIIEGRKKILRYLNYIGFMLMKGNLKATNLKPI